MKKERRKTYGWLVEKRPVDWIDECRSNFLGQFFEKLFHILQSGTTNRIFLILATQICFIKRVNERSATQVRGARRKTVKKKSRSFFLTNQKFGEMLLDDEGKINYNYSHVNYEEKKKKRKKRKKKHVEREFRSQ